MNRAAKVQFLRGKQTLDRIVNNDAYYARFCDADWKARGAKNRNDYLSKVVATDLDEIQKRKLTRAVQKACMELSTIRLDWFDGQKCAKMPFIIGCFIGDTYENGYPHTIGDAILLSENTIDEMTVHELVRLLKHEQTHVYQRRFPRAVRNFLRNFSFKRVKKQTKHDRFRANPDTDGVIYERFGKLYRFRWKNHEQVHGLHSLTSRRHPRFEHPFEDMAYRIEKMKNT